MALCDENWTDSAIHRMFLEYLRAERRNYDPKISPLLDQPDLHDAAANHMRMHLIYGTRRQLLGEIPPDTRWHVVEHLRDEHLDELRVIGRCGWDDDADGNEVAKVANRKDAQILKTKPEDWACPILWGHSEEGPFTILEGNNRLMAYSRQEEQTGFAVSALVGLSPSLCYWHRPDQPPSTLLHQFWCA